MHLPRAAWVRKGVGGVIAAVAQHTLQSLNTAGAAQWSLIFPPAVSTHTCPPSVVDAWIGVSEFCRNIKKLCAWPHYTSNLSRPGLPVHTRLTHGQLSGVRQREAAGSDKWMLIQFQPLMTWRDGLFKQLGDSGVLHWEHRGWRWREAGSSCLFSLADLFWKSNLHWWN